MEKSQSRFAESFPEVHVVNISRVESIEKESESSKLICVEGPIEINPFVGLMDFSKAVCKVEAQNSTGTGFLATFATPIGSCVHGLFTNNHVLSEQHLADDQVCTISFSGSSNFTHEVTPKGNFRFTCSVLDATFIQFGDSDVQKLEYNDRCFLKIASGWNPSKVHIFQYPEGSCLHYASGQTHGCRRHGLDLFHTASTKCGSSGSPVLLSNGQVIALHKACAASNSGDYNVAVTMKAIIDAVRPHFHSPAHPRHLICNFLSLDQFYARELRKTGLRRCHVTADFNFDCILFINPASTPIWFVATSHGWYWTLTNPSDKEKETNWMSVAQLDVIDGFENSETPDEDNIRIIDWLFQHNIERGICPKL